MLVKWSEISSDDVHKYTHMIVVWPLGVLEAHGPHLPLGADGFQVEHVVEKLSESVDIVLLPTLWYGNVEGLSSYPGSVSLSYDTLRSVVREVLTGVYRAGFRKVIIISGHAGGTHMSAVRHGARDVVREYKDLKVVVLSDYDFAYELRGKEFPEDDGHGGLIETSRMMAIRPDLVKKERVQKDNVFDYPRFLIIPDYKPLYKKGYRGYPTKASSNLGEKINDYIIKRLLDLIKKVF